MYNEDSLYVIKEIKVLIYIKASADLELFFELSEIPAVYQSSTESARMVKIFDDRHPAKTQDVFVVLFFKNKIAMI